MNKFSRQRGLILNFKKRFVPAGSVREKYWIELVQIYRLYLRDGPEGVIEYLWMWLANGKPISPAWWYASKDDHKSIEDFDNYLESVSTQDSRGRVIVYAGVPYDRTKPLRSVWITNEFNRLGYQVLFVYWRWRPSETYSQIEGQPGLYQLPMDVFWTHSGRILSEYVAEGKDNLFMIDFPHPSLLKVVNIANGFGWITVLTQKDDWEAFHKVGQASWYDREFEKYLMGNVDILVGTAQALVDKMRTQSGREVNFIPNAYDPESLHLDQAVTSMEKGELTLGYFGHLTLAWFDWDLVIALAVRNPKWLIYLIGSGGEVDQKPSNIRMLGRIPHEELAGYARNWDVAMIPFKEGELSRGVNPLKVYEYLSMDLPVVATGLPHLDVMPGVRTAQGLDEFDGLARELAEMGVDKGEVTSFLKGQTWERRVERILSLTKNVSKFAVKS